MAALGRRMAPLVAGALVAAGLAVAPAYADRNIGNAIDGPLTSGDSLFPNQGNGGYDVSHYDVDLAWTPAADGTIDADAPRSPPPPPARRCRRSGSTSRGSP